MKAPRLLKRMLILIGLASLLPLVSTIAISLLFAYRTVLADAERYAKALGENNAAFLSSRLETRSGAIRALAAAFSGIDALPAHLRRPAIQSELHNALEAFPDVISAWAMWEPGAVQDDPAAWKDSALATPSGRFNVTWYRSDSLILSGTVDDSAFEESYYQIPKQSRQAALLEPYTYTYSADEGTAVYETSLAMPILRDGRFYGVVGFDFAIDTFRKTVEGLNPFGSGYAALVSGKGVRIAHPLKEKVGGIVGEDLPQAAQAALLARIGRAETFTIERNALVGGRLSRQYYFPINVEGISKPWYLVLVVPEAEISAPARTMSLVLILLGLVAVAAVATAIFLVALSIARPIDALAEGARRLAQGEVGYRVGVVGEDEVATLARGFNAMADQVQLTLAGYDEVNRTLEAKVAERTASLESANRDLGRSNGELEDALDRLRSTQGELETSAKFAVLGRLFANMAHELNTPLGAIRSSVTFLMDASGEWAAATLPAYAALAPAGRDLFGRLLGRGAERARHFEAPEDRRAKRALAERLRLAGVARPDALADALTLLGAADLEEEVLREVAVGGRAAVDLAAQLTEAIRAEAIILEASGKATQTVAALGSYSRIEGYEGEDEVDPVREITTILALYYNKLKRSVAVERRFLTDRTLKGSRDALNQVWVNLINNALQSMEYAGRLEIEIREDGPDLVLEFTDSGPGIAPEHQDSIFKPFFTTKKPGEGTGLGLDICRRIVERHQGTIYFTSKPGRTTFTVRLPLGDKGSEP